MAKAVGTGLHDQVASARARLILNALPRMCRTGPAVLPGRHTVNVPGSGCATGDTSPRTRQLAAYRRHVLALGQQPIRRRQLPHDLLRRMPLPRRHDHRAFLPALGHSDSDSTWTYESGSGQIHRQGHPRLSGSPRTVRKRWTSSSSTSASSARGSGLQPDRSTATEWAAQISFIRVSRNRPNRLTRMATETLSTESRFTAERRGRGSSGGSSTTSLSSPRIVVVHGATSARRCRGITASRDRTTTGRRPISTISHHHTSPRGGAPSRTCHGPPKRLQVAPLVRFVKWVLVVGGVTGASTSADRCRASSAPHGARMFKQ